MKRFLPFLACLFLFVTSQAQPLKELRPQDPTVALFDESPKFSLDKLFSPEHFKLSHSYEMSYNSFGGEGLTTGVYTASLNWHLNQKLAARVDVGAMHTPFGTGNYAQAFGNQTSYSKVFVRNAEIAYRPKENTLIHLSFRQYPAGLYNPYEYGYGRYSPYYRGNRSIQASFGNDSRQLFWNPNLR